MVKVTLYYYSGTGNSLHVARELQKRIPGCELIPILGFRDEDRIKVNSERIGFVFPIYFTTIPAPVREFISKLDIGVSKYIFMVATRIGTFTIADKLVNSLLKKKGKKLDSYLIVNMASNSPTGLKPGKGDPNWIEKTSIENVLKLDEEMKPQLDEFCSAIQNKERHPKGPMNNPVGVFTRPLMDLLTKGIRSEVGYYVDDSCISCGTCEQVCLSRKIKIIDGKPLWQKDVQCYYCFACFNFCPKQSILVKKKYVRKDGRYHHPEVSIDDIIDQVAQ